MDIDIALDWGIILSFVFGGCCSNVWALEAVLQRLPASGTLLTLAQFTFVAIQSLPSQLSTRPFGLKKRKVPLTRWLVQVLMFLSVSLINNYVFALNIPVTLHIIFRSGGLCVSMLIGWLAGKRRFTVGQISAGVVITIGIIIATSAGGGRSKSRGEFNYGVGLLVLALIISAWLGLYQEETYRRYGKEWREGLFYTHTLSLPFFLPLLPSLRSTLLELMATPKVFGVPVALGAVAMNVVTQAVCIYGVNRLTARVNSTTVNLVLTVRKAVSLVLSAWLYGRGLSGGLLTGSMMVFVGTVVYSSSGKVKME